MAIERFLLVAFLQCNGGYAGKSTMCLTECKSVKTILRDFQFVYREDLPSFWYSSIQCSVTLPKQAHFCESPKRMRSVFRRPDLRSQRPKSIFSPPRKSSPCSSLSSSKNIPCSPSSLLLLTPIVLLLGERSTGLSTNPRQLCRWSLFQGAIIGSLPFWSTRDKLTSDLSG
ncbi:hypothetical protein AVEN_211110-1 [Araneus ventricosus]|uniref:Secreted protein n=1 Tax=Araneus ventricosus TaxID=182803 RepID=A0A4Y2TZM8_ARAVE|nr:hypothetical protein AVEN_211110-1 [Araneus ventricosus]